MHTLIAVDATNESHKLFSKFINKFKYDVDTGESIHPVSREIRFYNVIHDERDMKEFFTDIKEYEKGLTLSGRVMQGALGILGRFFPFLDIVDMSKYERRHKGDKVVWRNMFPKTLPPYILVIGNIPDKKDEDGKDMR